MSRVLVVDDDAGQLDIRRLLLEHAGHSVTTAADAAAARAEFARCQPEIAVVDLHLGDSGESGFALIREFRRRQPAPRIIVMSGWAGELAGREEAAMVDAVIPKPARTERLLQLIAKLALLALLLALPASAQKSAYSFTADRAGEALADITMSSPGANWSRTGHEAALADLRVDDGPVFNVMLYAGQERHTYPVFLGSLQPGPHRLTIEQNRQYSAPGTSVAVSGVAFKTGQDSPALAQAPVLFARRNTIGKFTDAPMVVYAETLPGHGEIVYTVIFTNEDGGTSTRALMARWGRTTDVEYVYRTIPGQGAIIQGRDHKDVVFQGKREGLHPLLIPITDNNMVGDGEPSPIRYQIAPVVVDLSMHSREQVMDEHPFTYRVMGEELIRERKLRPFGTVEEEKISDPRNYLYVEALLTNRSSAVAFNVRLSDSGAWRSGALGRADYAISRDGWIRTTIELPPGTKANQIAEIGLECLVAPASGGKWPLSGKCTVQAVSKVFLLDEGYRPGASIWSLTAPLEIPAGEMRTFIVGPR